MDNGDRESPTCVLLQASRYSRVLVSLAIHMLSELGITIGSAFVAALVVLTDDRGF